MIEPGMVLDKYSIEEKIGSGGMADVYLAQDTVMQRRVVLKVLPPEFVRDQERVARFTKEVRNSAGLQHPHIVTVYDVGQAEGYYYYTMSYLPNGDLKEKIANGMEIPDALSVLKQMAQALSYAHGKGFVHRDIKTENILFDDEDRAVLTDFGIAKAMGSGTRMTATGMSIGTPHYMSPEQARGRDVDGRSDLYSLGVILFEMLTGEVPYQAEDTFAVSHMHVNDPVPTLPEHLSRYQPLIYGLMAKDPESRFSTPDALLKALNHLELGEEPELSGKTVQKPAVKGKKGIARKMGPLGWTLGGAAAALIVAGLVYFLMSPDNKLPPGSGGGPIAKKTPKGKKTSPGKDISSGQAILRLSTNPEGARVFLEGNELGKTPLFRDDLPSGDYILKIDKKYYLPEKMDISLKDNEVRKKEFDLDKGQGKITVLSNPQEAKVYLDGKYEKGRTPLTLEGVEAGEHLVRVQKDHYYPEDKKIAVHIDETSRMDVSLKGGDLVEYKNKWIKPNKAVNNLLSAARKDIRADRLTSPKGRNALEKYARVLDLEPGNKEAEKGKQDIVERYIRMSKDALDKGDLNQAGRYLKNAAKVGKKQDSIQEMENRLAEVRKKRKNRVHNLLAEAKKDFQANRLTTPEGNNALDKYEQVLEIDPDNSNAEQGKKKIVQKYLDLAKEAIEDYKVDQAKEYVDKARQVGVLKSEIDRVASNIRAPQPGDTWTEPVTGMEFVWVEGGCYQMGTEGGDHNEDPAHEVCVDGFWMAKYEVTLNQYREYLQSSKITKGVDWDDPDCPIEKEDSYPLSGNEFSEKKNQPMIEVNWEGARAFAQWLSRESGKDFSLPTEAEWEYAARSRGKRQEFSGDDDVDDVAWYGEDWDNDNTHEVGGKDPNGLGIYDMSGNVWEWCRDVYDAGGYSRHSKINPVVTSEGSKRVHRGGGWSSDDSNSVRTYNRYGHEPDFTNKDLGFRLCIHQSGDTSNR